MILYPGKRLFCAGQTGSGKTRGLIWHASMQTLPIIVLDTKIDDTFSRELPDAHIRDRFSIDNLMAHYDKNPTCPPLILRPDPEQYDPEKLDGFLLEIYRTCDGACIVIDELYMFHRGYTAGPGLVALLTRGRAKHLSVMMAAQRPAYLSQFCLSETDAYLVYNLRLRADRERLASVSGAPELLEAPPNKFCYWCVNNEVPGAAFLQPPVPQIKKAHKINTLSPLDMEHINFV